MPRRTPAPPADRAGVAHAPWGVLLHERARPERVREWPHAWWLAVATVCFGAFMGQLDASIVTLTYPALKSQFHARLAGVEWVSLSYLLVLVALLVPVGRLSDAYGRKLYYLYGFVVFTGASAACAFAPTLWWLVGFRIVQALGAAMLQANSVALVTTSAPPERMRSALGVQAAAQALGLALGPSVGGVVVATLGWRWVFGINIPVGVVALVAGYYLLPRTRQRTSAEGFDWGGVVLLTAATTALLLGISAASGLDVPAWGLAALFAAAVAAGWGFVARQRTATAPLVDLTLLRTRRVAVGLVGALCGYLVLFGPLVLVPVALTGAGSSAVVAGVSVTALPVGFALAATGADRVLPRAWRDQQRCAVGAVVSAAALFGLAAAPLTAGWLAAMLGVLGLGLGAFMPANNALVMGAIPTRAAGTGGGLVNMTRALGTALGVALVTLALNAGSVPHPVLSGPRLALLLLAAVAALLSLTVRRG